MDEFALIRRFFDRPIKDGSVLLGIGDDGAVIAPDPDRQLICVVDTIVAGVHYFVDNGFTVAPTFRMTTPEDGEAENSIVVNFQFKF